MGVAALGGVTWGVASAEGGTVCCKTPVDGSSCRLPAAHKKPPLAGASCSKIKRHWNNGPLTRRCASGQFHNRPFPPLPAGIAEWDFDRRIQHIQLYIPCKWGAARTIRWIFMEFWTKMFQQADETSNARRFPLTDKSAEHVTRLTQRGPFTFLSATVANLGHVLLICFCHSVHLQQKKRGRSLSGRAVYSGFRPKYSKLGPFKRIGLDRQNFFCFWLDQSQPWRESSWRKSTKVTSVSAL